MHTQYVYVILNVKRIQNSFQRECEFGLLLSLYDFLRQQFK